jgi:FkbM family methyltransferase
MSFLSRAKQRLYNRPAIDESWYLLNYFLRPSRSATKRIQGAKMLLDLNDPGINRDLFLYGHREPECTKIYRDSLEPGMHIVDIGANVGYFVLIAAQAIGPEGKIYAVEPAPNNFERLKKNLALNTLPPEIETYNMAVSDRVGKISFELAQASNHHRLAIEGSAANCIDVATTTVDELVGDRRIDVLRMDTEGSEWVILKGMPRLLASGKPLKIFIEVHPKLIRQYHGDMAEWLRVIADAGFRVKYAVTWVPESHSVIPYVKGRMPREQPIHYDQPRSRLLEDKEASRLLLSRSGHAHGAGYKLFLER